MQTDITAYKFCEIIGIKSQGTASKYVSKGLIILCDKKKFVDLVKTIDALKRGRPNHQLLAQKALEFFNKPIKPNPPQEVLTIDQSDQRTHNVTPHYDNDDDYVEPQKSSLMEAMRDKYLIDIKLKQVQLNEKIGKLVDRETVLIVFENIIMQLKKDLLSLSRSTIDSVLREKNNPQAAEKILYEAIHGILHKNSKTKI